MGSVSPPCRPAGQLGIAGVNADDLASPMYSTGIGLVIEGIERYEADLEKRNKVEEKIAEEQQQEENETEEPKKEKSKRPKFIDKIREFFEQDDI